MLRWPHCKIKQSDGSWFVDDGQVTVNGESPAARVSIFSFDGSRMVQKDRLENAEVFIDDRTGEVTIHGDSQYLLQNQGVAMRTKFTVIPGPRGCSHCG